MELNIHSECPKCGEKKLELVTSSSGNMFQYCPGCRAPLQIIRFTVQDLLKALTAAKSREAKLEAERDWLASTPECPADALCLPRSDCKECRLMYAAKATADEKS